MINLVSRLICCLLAFSLAWLPAATAREGDRPDRIIAIGDLHGDYEVWRSVARRAGLVDSRGRWTGGETTLVQLGDVTDRGPDSLKIIRHLQRLQERASRKGGQVIVLLGNHEAMNVIGDLRYVDPGEYAAFKDRNSKKRREIVWEANQERIKEAYATLDPPVGPEEAKKLWFDATPLGMLEHRLAWRPGGELAQWAETLPAVVQIGEIIFVHGGLSIEHAVEPLEMLNARYRAALQPGEVVDRNVLEDPLGLLWYRGNVRREKILGPQEQGELMAETSGEDGSVAPQPETPEHVEPPRPSPDEELTQVLARYGATRLVVGHTPSITGIVAARDGRLIRIDTGMSSYYGGPPSFLEILGDRIIAYQQDAEGNWHGRDLPRLTQEMTP